jgi:putative ABC transport system ATP-binding protein
VIDLAGVAKRLTLPSGEPLDILTDVSLQLEAGSTVAIVGRSGSGKSTLLNVMGLLDSYDSGSYRIDGVDARTLGDRLASRLRGTTFGFVFQQFHLLDRRSALANVAAPLTHGPSEEYDARDRRAMELLSRVGLADRAASLPSQLSGGEQQRVAIARSLVRRPKVLLADEPTGSLDVDTGARVLDILLGLAREDGCAVVLVTHDMQVASRADRQMILEGGSLREAA